MQGPFLISQIISPLASKEVKLFFFQAKTGIKELTWKSIKWLNSSVLIMIMKIIINYVAAMYCVCTDITVWPFYVDESLTTALLGTLAY